MKLRLLAGGREGWSPRNPTAGSVPAVAYSPAISGAALGWYNGHALQPAAPLEVAFCPVPRDAYAHELVRHVWDQNDTAKEVK